MGKSRTLSVCLTDIPKGRLRKHNNGKIYLNLTTWDYDEKDKYQNDFSVSLPITDEQKKEKEAGKEIKRIYLGSGRIWGDNSRELSDQEKDDLPF